MLGGYHDIKTDGSLRGNLPGQFHFLMNGAGVGLLGVFGKIRLREPDLSGRDNPHTASLGDGPGQPVQADPDAHSSLDNRFLNN